MLVLPISDVPSQTFNTQLGGQPCTINIYQKSTGLFMDILINDVLVLGGVICENLNRIVRDTYLGFVGDLLFNDTQGDLDPSFPGLGSRYQLFYATEAELA